MKMQQKAEYDHVIKLVIIGDSGVGKTCFLMRFAEDSFTSTHISTVGIDFKIKPVVIDGKTIKLQIWDTAGQERFRTITQTYYKGALGIVLTYDCTDLGSFANIRSWLQQIEAHANHDVIKILIGNKCDRPDKKVTTNTAKALADEHHMVFLETSAKTGVNVRETFYLLTKEINAKLLSKLPAAMQGFQVNHAHEEAKKAGCC